MDKTIFIKLISFGSKEKIIEIPDKSTIADLRVIIKATGSTYLYRETQKGEIEEVKPNQALFDKDILILAIRMKGEADIKCLGRVWRVHKNDPDKLRPSDFHLHDLENGDKLDLYTGELYSYDFRYIKKIRKKKHKFCLEEVKKRSDYKERVEMIMRQ